MVYFVRWREGLESEFPCFYVKALFEYSVKYSRYATPIYAFLSRFAPNGIDTRIREKYYYYYYENIEFGKMRKTNVAKT